GKTAPKSVDAKGAIVGVYIDDSGVQRAFVRSPGGVLRRYNALKGAEIDSITSNDRGVIAGSYYENGISGGFLQAVVGTLTKFGAADGTNVWITAINHDAWIVGQYGTYLDRSFVRDPAGVTTLLDAKLHATGISRSGEITGSLGKSAFIRSTEGEIVRI